MQPNVKCFYLCVGAIEIEATPPGVVTIGGVESVMLTCTLQSIEPDDGIVYVWTRSENSLPSGAQINGSELFFNNMLHIMLHI